MKNMGYESAAELLERTKDYLFERKLPDALMTGFGELDDLTGGFNKGELICIAGRPGIGKTGFALSMVRNICIEEGKGCLYLSLDSLNIRLIGRLITVLSGESGLEWRTDPYESENVRAAVESIKGSSLYINSMLCRTIEEIADVCKSVFEKEGIDLVIIDYYQLIGSLGESKETGNRDFIVRELKRMAMELQLPVIVLSQVSRCVERRKDHRPLLKDLKDRGEIVSYSDKVIFLYRDDYYYHSEEGLKGGAEVIVAHNSGGVSGVARLLCKDGNFVDFPI